MIQPHPKETPEWNHQDTDSPVGGEPVFLVVGRLRRSHGVKGEIGMEILTDFPKRLHSGVQVYIGENHKPLNILTIRPKDKLLLLSFEGFNNCEQVNILRNEYVYILGNHLPPLPDGQYYHHQLLGLQVVNETGEILGNLSEILNTGANDVYVVRSAEGSEILLPAIKGVIVEINLEQGVIISHPPEWLA